MVRASTVNVFASAPVRAAAIPVSVAPNVSTYDDVWQELGDPRLRRRRQDGTARCEREERQHVEIVARTFQIIEQGARHRVADHRHHVHALLGDERPDLARVEPPGRREHHGCAAEEPVEGAPVGADVDERWRVQLHHRDLGQPRRQLAGIGDRPFVEERVTAAQRREEKVLVPPDDALGQPGCAPGVGDVEVVAGAARPVPGVIGDGEAVFVIDAVRARRRIGAIVHDEHVAQRRRARRIDRGTELSVDDEGDEVGVIVQVPELVSDVAVVHIDRHRGQLECSQHPLDVLGPVEQLEADPVAAADAVRPQMVGESVGARLELGVAEPASGGVEGGPVAHGVDHALEQLRDVEAHGASAREEGHGTSLRFTASLSGRRDTFLTWTAKSIVSTSNSI